MRYRPLCFAAIGHEANAREAEDHHGPRGWLWYWRYRLATNPRQCTNVEGWIVRLLGEIEVLTEETSQRGVGVAELDVLGIEHKQLVVIDICGVEAANGWCGTANRVSTPVDS
jgi:hypothetical protein